MKSRLHGMTHKERVAKRVEVFNKQGGLCWICAGPMDLQPATRNPPTLATFDHFVPQCIGGLHDDGNLRVAHHGCNTYRGHENLFGVPLTLKAGRKE